MIHTPKPCYSQDRHKSKIRPTQRLDRARKACSSTKGLIEPFEPDTKILDQAQEAGSIPIQAHFAPDIMRLDTGDGEGDDGRWVMGLQR